MFPKLQIQHTAAAMPEIGRRQRQLSEMCGKRAKGHSKSYSQEFRLPTPVDTFLKQRS
jgi:hypothetical protein